MILEQIAENIVRGHVDSHAPYPPDMRDKPGVVELVQQAIDEKIPVTEILNKGLIAGMEIVGKKFSDGLYFVPEMLIAARAMKAGMEKLRPLLIDSGVQPKGVVILGTVEGDMHDIGKNLVGMMLEGAGFKIVDLGVDVPAQRFVEIAKTNEGAIVGLSALLTMTMEKMKTTIEGLRNEGLKHKVMVGGAPVTQDYADKINAEGYAPDAALAVQLAKSLVPNH